jgi:hypothetical protein
MAIATMKQMTLVVIMMVVTVVEPALTQKVV